MRRVSLNEPDLQPDADDPPGFRALMWRFGRDALGASRTGMSLYEIPAGESVCPYHYEAGEDEWILVLEGTPTVRDPDGMHELSPMDVVYFPPGPEGAHQIRNDSDAPARVLMFGENILPGVSVYPDSDKVGVWTTNPADSDLLFRRGSAVPYFDGESNQR